MGDVMSNAHGLAFQCGSYVKKWSLGCLLQFGILTMTSDESEVLYPIYTEQKFSRLRSGLQSRLQSRLQSGLRSRRCTRLHGTFIVQYNKANHIIVNCSVIVTWQSS